MKRFIPIKKFIPVIPLGIALGLLLSGTPVMAFSDEVNNNNESSIVETLPKFHSLSKIPVSLYREGAALTLMTESQLAAIEGMRRFGNVRGRPPRPSINIGLNFGVTNQFNICGICIGSNQFIVGRNFQVITFP